MQKITTTIATILLVGGYPGWAATSVNLTGPYAQHLSEESVRIYWQTEEACSSIVEYGTARLTDRVEDVAPKTEHAVTLAGLRPETEYTYAIKVSREGVQETAGPYMLDTTFDNWVEPLTGVASPYPVDSLTPMYAAAAESILARSGVQRGYCLVYGFGEGRLAFEIAKRSELKIVGIEEDANAIATARGRLREAGIYGDRISVQADSLSELPYRDYFANLIVSDRLLSEGQVGGEASELLRVLRPCGGVLLLGQPATVEHPLDAPTVSEWLTSGGLVGCEQTVGDDGIWLRKVREPLEGSGEWTHHYAEPGNSACSQDSLVQDPMEVLWFGRPGPRVTINRHSRPMSPLYKNGRVFIPADDRVIAADAYNGTRLWDLSVPGSRRLGAFKGCAQMAVTDEYLYITQGDNCHAVDVLTGLPGHSMTAPQPLADATRDWGYLACVGDQIVGTGHRVGTPFYEYTYNGNCNVLEEDNRVSMVSEYIFSNNRLTGKPLWTYQVGAILESSISVGDGRVYFAENRNLPAAEGQWEGPGRRWVGHFTAGDNTHLVALDLASGNVVWERPVNLPYTEMMYLSYADDIVLTVGSYNQGSDCYYGIFAYDAGSGQPKWEDRYDSGFGPGGSHGEQWQHPVILGGRLVSRPYDYDLQSGVRGSFSIKKGGGCGTYSASSDYLFARDGNPSYYKYGSTHRGALCRVTRPGCFINIIPVGGIVLVPESGSGCTCEYSIQTSMAFVPR